MRRCNYCGQEYETMQGAISCQCEDNDVMRYQGEKIAALEAELKQLRDEDATDPIDERLAAAGKIFRELVAEREELLREVKRLRAEVEEYDFTFDLHHKAEMRGIKQWQKDTGRALTLPDTAKFTVWLIERLDKLGGLDSETSASE